MRVVLDTNILVSALLIQVGHPAAIYRAWHEGHFTLLTCSEQLDELRATLSKPALAARIKPYQAGRLVNELNELAETMEPSNGPEHIRFSPAHPPVAQLPAIGYHLIVSREQALLLRYHPSVGGSVRG